LERLTHGRHSGLSKIDFEALRTRFKQSKHKNIEAERETLFWFNALLIASNGTDSRVGSLTADWERFFEVLPHGQKRIERDALGVAAVPNVFGGLDFLTRGFFGEGREWRAWVHVSSWISTGLRVRRCVA
jgi:hypothetical protein